eukprot:504444_1
MSADPQKIAKDAYLAYIIEKGFAPKNPSHLVNFSKLHNPPFIGVKYSMAKKIISNPPNVGSNPPAVTTQSNPPSIAKSNPYLDSSITNKFISPNENETFIKKHTKTSTQSKIANAYDSYKQKMGTEPNNAIQFLQFCEQNSLKITYSECAQYIQNTKQSTNKSRVRALSESLLNQNIALNEQKSEFIKSKPFKSGDPNAKPIKTVFQALSELEDINNDEKYELIEQTNNASFVKITNKKETDSKLHEYLEETMKIKNTINISCPEEIKSSHSYHDDRYGKHVKITPISPDPILSVHLGFNYNEWDINTQNEFINDLASELNVNPAQLIPICTASGSVEFIIQICNIIKDKFPLIEKKCVTLKENTNKICTKWKLKASKLKNWASNKLCVTKQNSKAQQIELNNINNNNETLLIPKLDTAEKWLLNQAETLRNQIIESLQDCPQEFEISGICALDNDKCLN